MKLLLGILFVSSIPHLCMNQDPKISKHLAVVELASGESRVFSGESVHLKCSVPDDVSTWRYVWFKGNVMLQETERFEIWNANIQQEGKYSCQGVRETHRGPIRTLQSLPIEIYVEGGWVLLHGPSKPPLVGGSMTLTYRVRGNPRLEGGILYKDGQQVMTQLRPSTHFLLENLTAEDQGSYWCRVTWDIQRLSHSAMSTPIRVSVREVLTKPSLLIEDIHPKSTVTMMRLVCLLQFNAPTPDIAINYYFYKNSLNLSPSTSNDNLVVARKPGRYECKARVPMLDLVEWSEPVSFDLRDKESPRSPSILEVIAFTAAKPKPIRFHDLQVQPSLSSPKHLLKSTKNAINIQLPDQSTDSQANVTTFPSQLPFKSAEPANNTL